MTGTAEAAQPPTLQYDCEVNLIGSQPFTAVVRFPQAPAYVHVGEDVNLGPLEAQVGVPQSVVGLLRGFMVGATSMTGQTKLNLKVGGQPVALDGTSPSTDIPPGGSMTMAASAAGPVVKAAELGDLKIEAADFESTLSLFGPGGKKISDEKLPCKLKPGQTLTVQSIKVLAAGEAIPSASPTSQAPLRMDNPIPEPSGPGVVALAGVGGAAIVLVLGAGMLFWDARRRRRAG